MVWLTYRLWVDIFWAKTTHRYGMDILRIYLHLIWPVSTVYLPLIQPSSIPLFPRSTVTSFNLHRPKAINNAYLSTHSFSLLLAYYPSPSLSLPPLIQSTRSFAKCWQTDDRPTDSTMLLQSLLIWSSQSRSPYNSKMILSPNIDQAGSYCLWLVKIHHIKVRWDKGSIEFLTLE